MAGWSLRPDKQCDALKIVVQERPLLVQEVGCLKEAGHQPPHDHYPYIWYEPSLRRTAA